MGKSVQKVMTRGVQNLGLSQTVIETLFKKAEGLLSSTTFLAFGPKGQAISINDGNGKSLGTLPFMLPEKVWIIFDDHGAVG
ncbi:hypothetical protein M5X11_28010 [Paenibacillus alginolyticus]|uniref:hypothetical protein n=1 Tax=Paenibacillus alginolyticus TaxID=59839 RepID=UPI000416FEAD|nr:hypothetical protein [Paenibacillus alginolyticus]MCY9668723.1 hypothetical protein [Paenibacillus alginolyticus]